MKHDAPRPGVPAAPAGFRVRRGSPTALIVLVVATAAILAIRLDVSPMLSAVLDEESTSRGAGWALLLLYTVLLALPFVPGAEIGLALLVVFGAVMAWPVYVATVLALSIAFAVGRLASRSRNPAPFRKVPSASDPIVVFSDALRDRRGSTD